MDWNLKTPWDLTDFEQETIPNGNPISGSSSFGGQGVKGDFSVDLQLGHVVDSGNELGETSKVPNVPKMALSHSHSSKRARAAISNGGQTASCLVDGCYTDLSNCREYHRRHKVCEIHSKTPQVTINGHSKRFCQQCSRFHSLEEFDDGKRSCRKRLDGHNRRRRKPQPEPLSRAGNFLPSHQVSGNRLLQFYNPQVYSTTAVANPIWAGVVKAEEDAKFYNHHLHSHLPDKLNAVPEFPSSSDKMGKQFSFANRTNLELSNQSAQATTVCQPLLKNIASSGSGGASNKMLCEEFSTRVLHSDCALSLLSSSPTQTSDINSIPVAYPLDSGINYNSMEPMESILVPNVSDADVHCLDMFHMAPHAFRGSSENQTLPFYWE